MKSENLIHVKFERQEAIQSKKDILEYEKDLLKLLRAVKRYHLLRSEELKIKDKLSKKIKEFKTSLSKLEKNLPHIKVPEIISQGREEKPLEKKISSITRKPKEDDLEFELRELQQKLKSLE